MKRAYFHRCGNVLVMLTCAVMTTSGSAITINLVYDEDLNPAWDPDGSLLMTHAHAAAQMWADYFIASFSITIDVSWASLDSDVLGRADSVWDTIKLQADVANMPKDQNGNMIPWYIDPNPWSHTEFDFSGTGTAANNWAGQTLYRDLTPSQKSAWFGGSAPDLMEVGYRGAAMPGSDAAGRFDLLSTVAHEIGHILGVNWDPLAGSWYPPSFQLGGHSLEIMYDNGHVAPDPALMCDGCGAVGIRRLPSTVDILAVADDESWPNVDLPRQDFLGGSVWHSGIGYQVGVTAWEGGRPPDGGDEVYLRHGGPVTLVTSATVGSLLVDEGSRLFTGSQHLTVNDTLVIAGAALTTVGVESGGVIEAFETIVDGELYIESPATFDTWRLAIGDDGRVTLDGGALKVNHIGFHGDMTGLIAGHGIIDASGFVNNDGTIAASGGDLLLWSTSGTGIWNLDGVGNNGILAAIDGNMTILGPHLSFEGTMSIGPGRSVSINHNDWRLGPAGTLLMLGTHTDTATFRTFGGNGHATIEGTIILHNTGVLDIPVTFGPTANVTVNASNAQLTLAGPTTFRGGSYTGDGIIVQRGDATVETSTLIDVGIYDFDGDVAGGSATYIAPNATFTINALGIEPTLVNRYDGTLTVDGGVLQMNTHERFTFDPVPWQVGRTGTIHLRNPGWEARVNRGAGPGGVARGSPVTIEGEVYATGGANRIEADVTFVSNSFTHLADGVSDLVLAGATTFFGGSFTGTGSLHQEGDATVSANTTISVATYNWDGLEAMPSSTIVEADVTFNLNVQAIDTPGGGGYGGTVTLEAGAVLNVNTPMPWQLDGAMVIHNASVTGSDLINHGTISGTGVLYAQVDNHGSISPGLSAGAMLIDGDYIQHATASLFIEFGGTSTSEYDWVIVTGAASFGGELHLALIDGFIPDATDTFVSLAAINGISGAFANVASGQRLELVNGIGSFLVHYGPASPLNPTHLSLTAFELALLLGDMNLDGTVDTADVAPFVLALTNPQGYMAQFGVDEATMTALGDINQDGAFDTADVAPFVQLLVGGGPQSVPEPGSLALLSLGVLMLWRRRIRRQRAGRWSR